MKRHAPAAERNRAPILEVLRSVLPGRASVLEIGSGTGQHAAFFADAVPGWSWQPTDASDGAVASIEEYRREATAPGFLPPLRLDVREGAWPAGPYDAVFSANVIHIAPWSVCLAVLDGAARVLAADGLLVFYGPFRFDGAFTADSNAAFDARLRGQDPAWGVRDVADLRREAAMRGFTQPDVFPMPANNHVLVMRRAPAV